MSSEAPTLDEDQEDGHAGPTRCPEYYNGTEPPLLLFPPVPDRSINTILHKQMSNASYAKVFSSCSATCQFQVIPKCPPSHWELQTLDEHGSPKDIGGDEFYTTFTDERRYNNQQYSLNEFPTQPFTAAAWSTDLQNGRYRLDFQAPPFTTGFGLDGVERGILAIYSQYTCKVGYMGPVAKGRWRMGGSTVAFYQSDVLPIAPPIRAFDPPSIDSTRPKLEDFQTLIPFGDSLLHQFMAPLGIKLPNVNKALHMDNVGLWKKELDATVTKKSNGTQLIQETAAILTNSCVWDILEDLKMTTSTADGSPEWSSHQRAVEEFLSHIHQTLPNVTVFWKSCTGVHIHIPMLQNPILSNLTNDKFHRRIKCMSTHRAWGLYSVQKDVVQREIARQQGKASLLPSQDAHPQRLFFLDLYPASYLSAFRSSPGDGRHYKPELSRQVVSWFANATRVKEILKQ